jgi:hypothetical protein
MTDISESGIEAALLPCPFCGTACEVREVGHGRAAFKKIEHGTPGDDDKDGWKCPAIGWRVVYDGPKDLAAWNRRHPPASREEGLREDLGLRDDLLIKAEKFRFGPDLTVESRGPSQWAVCHPGEVLNADGEWEWEPQPSSRTDEFIARTRFTFAEAVKRARALQSKKPE